MRKLVLSVLCVVLCSVPLTGCFTMKHQVGQGAQGNTKTEDRQWWALWGLVPIGTTVDSKQMAGGATDYTVQTQWAPLDVVINFFSGIVSIYSQTITVTK